MTIRNNVPEVQSVCWGVLGFTQIHTQYTQLGRPDVNSTFALLKTSLAISNANTLACEQLSILFFLILRRFAHFLCSRLLSLLLSAHAFMHTLSQTHTHPLRIVDCVSFFHSTSQLYILSGKIRIYCSSNLNAQIRFYSGFTSGRHDFDAMNTNHLIRST